jgi:hypothetical protein
MTGNRGRICHEKGKIFEKSEKNGYRGAIAVHGGSGKLLQGLDLLLGEGFVGVFGRPRARCQESFSSASISCLVKVS